MRQAAAGDNAGNYGVYTGPSIPPEYASLYGEFSPTTYGGSAPSSAPSAPVYSPPAPPSYHQPVPPSNSLSQMAGAYYSQYASDYSQSFNSPNTYAPGPLNPDPSATASSYGGSYSPSYAPVVPTYPAVVPAYDRSFEFGVGSAPTSTHLEPSSTAQRSSYGNANYGATPQQGGPPAGYETYDSQGQGGHQQNGGEEGGRFDMYGHATGYGRSESKRTSNGDSADRNSENGAFLDVYAYDGGGVEPYGARGTGGNPWSAGGSGSLGGYSFINDTSAPKSNNVARETPNSGGDSEAGGIQKFRVKLLPENRSTDSIKEVVCQIGLDGVRMVDPVTSRTLRIYPLDTITKWEVKEPSVFTFWAKSSVDVDQRMIQLQSNTYSTTTILDTLTAACVQLCEMGKDGTNDSSASAGGTGATGELAKKSSVLDWVALRPRAANPEEKQHWVPDEAVTKCTSCDTDFGPFLRRHHCRNCGDIFCDKCTRGRIALNTDEDSQPVRVCDRCLAEITQRLENPKPTNAKLPTLRTHEDLARKLQEELERNNAARKPAMTRTSSSHAASSGQSTSVVNCSKCGSVTLVTGSGTRCSNCESSNRSSLPERRNGGFSGSPVPHGPPHLWSTNAPASDRPGPRMREVACPTCTVHLQVQVPSFGTETIECGVCQHPFLVSA